MAASGPARSSDVTMRIFARAQPKLRGKLNGDMKRTQKIRTAAFESPFSSYDFSICSMSQISKAYRLSRSVLDPSCGGHWQFQGHQAIITAESGGSVSHAHKVARGPVRAPHRACYDCKPGECRGSFSGCQLYG